MFTPARIAVILGYSESPRGMRLRLRFDDRELVVEERHTVGIAIGRADENNVLVKGDRSSRLHARIMIGRNNFVLIDESTNGTRLQTGDIEGIPHADTRLAVLEAEWRL